MEYCFYTLLRNQARHKVSFTTECPIPSDQISSFNALMVSCTIPRANPFNVYLNQSKKMYATDGPASTLHFFTS